MLKKYTSFKFKGHDKKTHHIRDKKLGLIFTHTPINRCFQRNAQRQQREAQVHQQQVRSAQKRALQSSISASAASSAKSASASVSASISQSASASRSASVSYAPVRQRNYSASIGRSHATSTYSSAILAVSQHSAESLSRIANIVIRPEWSSLTSRFSSMLIARRHAKDAERKRVIRYMPQFHSRKAQRYASWHYGHAIPAYCVGYDGRIPEFSVNRKDRSLLHRMTSPIVRGFKRSKHFILSKWRSGKQAINSYIYKHHIKVNMNYYEMPDGDLDPNHNFYNSHLVTYPMNIINMAQDEKHRIIRGFEHTAKKFHNAWHRIKSDFHDRFIQPIISRFHHASNSANSASSARECALSERSSATNYAKASATNAMTTATKSRNRMMSQISDESVEMSISSYDKTPQGQSENAAWQRHETHMKSYAYSIEAPEERERSARSQSVSASKSASSSASKASWTSSVANFNYSSWLSIDDSFFDREFDSSQEDVPSYKMSVINSMGESKSCQYNGVDNSHKKNNVYRNAIYYQKNVSFNKYRDLIRQDFKRSQSNNEKIQRVHSISRDDGHGIE